MSKITHPVRVGTRIQAVLRQGAALGSTSTAGQDMAVKRKKRDSPDKRRGTEAESQSFSSTT